MSIFQKIRIPNFGKNNKQKRINAPTSQTAACTARQIPRDFFDNAFPDLKSKPFLTIGLLSKNGFLTFKGRKL
jgi:hypothetical protein